MRPIEDQKPRDRAWIALGSNLGDSRGILDCAITRLGQFSVKPLLRSSYWCTSPVDCPPGSPMFLNAVVGLTPRQGDTPESLLSALQQLETEFGRRRTGVANEPRPLDLDLIAFGREMRATEKLVLPHPRAHERRFVLEPLNEVAPDLVLPGQTRPVSQLLRELTSGEVVRRWE